MRHPARTRPWLQNRPRQQNFLFCRPDVDLKVKFCFQPRLQGRLAGCGFPSLFLKSAQTGCSSPASCSSCLCQMFDKLTRNKLFLLGNCSAS